MDTITQSQSQQLTLEVIFDFVCPWCYIGQRNLQTALQRFAQERPQASVAVRWLPYFLDPDTPIQGSPYRPYLERKFGGATQLDVVWARITEAGRRAGIIFSFDKIELRANTLNAHRLIHSFQQYGNVDAMVECIFAAHFQRGQHISDVKVLADIAAECSADASAVCDYLISKEGCEEVSELVTQIQQTGVGGVPFFIFNRRLAISGAQSPEVILDAIHQMFAAT